MKRKWMGEMAFGVVATRFSSFCSNSIEMNNKEIPMGIDVCVYVRVVVGPQQKSQWKGHCE